MMVCKVSKMSAKNPGANFLSFLGEWLGVRQK